MPRITKVYTRTGDDGSTGLGDGSRVPKESLRVEAYGTVDEVNSHVGLALASGAADQLAPMLERIQHDLFNLGSDLCFPEDKKVERPVARIEPRHVDRLEAFMDELSNNLPNLENFILPGGHLAAGHLHVARTVCRRAERDVLRLSRQEDIGEHTVRYLNRLSDAFFVMARYQNAATGQPDTLWRSRD